MSDPVAAADGRPRIALAVCTYNRAEPLATLLEAVTSNAARLAGRARVGVVVVDDSADGNARPVAERFADRFELGLVYRVSGRQNIALARNLALETALGLADWIAMTDDDCQPEPDWLATLLDLQQRTSADAICGRLSRRVPPGSPRWLTEEPFLELGHWEGVEDGAEIDSAATHNSMLSGRWLKEHPHIRFDPALGVTGGEDPVFYRAAHAAGLRIRYSRRAVVHENEPASRATLGYQLRLYFWHGNSAYITCVRRGAHPLRMFRHGAGRVLSALGRPVARLARGEPPQLRYGLASVLWGLGAMSGLLGVRVAHR
jgi:glycosyltransferase involved in cell wall biosynthesis